MRKRLLCLLAVSAIAVGATGCGDKTLSKGEIEKQAQKFFDGVAQQQGQKNFPKITCPDDLKAEKGQTTRCSATSPEGTLGITVTVNSVNGDTVNLHFKGDDQITPPK